MVEVIEMEKRLILHNHLLLDRTLMTNVWLITNPRMQVTSAHMMYFKRKGNNTVSEAQLIHETHMIERFIYQLRKARSYCKNNLDVVSKSFIRVYGI
jgi:hypothetical protein